MVLPFQNQNIKKEYFFFNKCRCLSIFCFIVMELNHVKCQMSFASFYFTETKMLSMLKFHSNFKHFSSFGYHFVGINNVTELYNVIQNAKLQKCWRASPPKYLAFRFIMYLTQKDCYFYGVKHLRCFSHLPTTDLVLPSGIRCNRLNCN